MYFHKFPSMFVYTFHITIFDFYRYNRYQIYSPFPSLIIHPINPVQTNFHFYVMDIEHQIYSFLILIFFLINLKTTPPLTIAIKSTVHWRYASFFKYDNCQYHHTIVH